MPFYINKQKKKVQIDKANRFVRIHGDHCQCKRIYDICRQHFIVQKRIDYVIENHDNLKDPDDCKYIFMEKNNWNDKSGKPDGFINDKSLIAFFKNVIDERNFIFFYFQNHNWTCKFYNIVPHLSSSIVFCSSEIDRNPENLNAGTILVGKRQIIGCVAKKYYDLLCNNLMREFEKLYFVQITKMKGLLNLKKCDHSVHSFIESKQFSILQDEPELYVIIGKFAANSRGFKYGFAFGKREWFPYGKETSEICARRELFEEFKIECSRSVEQTNPAKFIKPSRIKSWKSNIISAQKNIFIRFIPDNATLITKNKSIILIDAN